MAERRKAQRSKYPGGHGWLWTQITKDQKDRLGAEYPRGEVRTALEQIAAELSAHVGRDVTYKSLYHYRMMLAGKTRAPQVSHETDEKMIAHLWAKEDSFNSNKLQHSSPEKFAEAVNRILRGDAYYG